MRAAKHLYRVSLVLLLLVVRWGGADIPEGGPVQEDQEFNEVSFDRFSFYFPNQTIFLCLQGSS